MAKEAENVLIPSDATINLLATMDVLSVGFAILIILVVWFALAPKEENNVPIQATFKTKFLSTTNLLRMAICGALLGIVLVKYVG